MEQDQAQATQLRRTTLHRMRMRRRARVDALDAMRDYVLWPVGLCGKEVAKDQARLSKERVRAWFGTRGALVLRAVEHRGSVMACEASAVGRSAAPRLRRCRDKLVLSFVRAYTNTRNT